MNQFSKADDIVVVEYLLKLIPSFGMIKLIARIARLDCNVILPLCQSLTWQPAGLALDKETMLGEKQSVRSLLKSESWS